MKRLFLVRHAKSSWEMGPLPDAERPLNERGYRDAPRVGAYLAGHYARPDLVLSSHAIRAYSTALILTRQWGIPPAAITLTPDLYESSVEAYAEVLRELDSRAYSALLAGHNFIISHFASFLTGREEPEFPTCGVAVFDLAIDDWAALYRACGTVVERVYPKTLPDISATN